MIWQVIGLFWMPDGLLLTVIAWLKFQKFYAGGMMSWSMLPLGETSKIDDLDICFEMVFADLGWSRMLPAFSESKWLNLRHVRDDAGHLALLSIQSASEVDQFLITMTMCRTSMTWLVKKDSCSMSITAAMYFERHPFWSRGYDLQGSHRSNLCSELDENGCNLSTMASSNQKSAS